MHYIIFVAAIITIINVIVYIRRPIISPFDKITCRNSSIRIETHYFIIFVEIGSTFINVPLISFLNDYRNKFVQILTLRVTIF